MAAPSPHALLSPLLSSHGFRHAFFTRRGGVSVGAYGSLNFSFSVGDNAEHVDRNLRLAAEHLGVDVSRVYFLSQVHGNRCFELTGSEEQRDVVFSEGDALVSGSPNLACSVRTADCIPILFADPLTGRVGAAHAGWRGLVARVIEQTVRTLVPPERAHRLLAAVGPHISVDAFEVSDDVALALKQACPSVDPVVSGRGKPHVDLRQVAHAQLLELGLPAAHISHVEGCTYTDSDLFFSFRRDGKASGRHLSAIVARC